MNKPYFVTFAGHRELDNFAQTEQKLTELLTELLENHEFVEFSVGIDGEFDIMAASVVRRVRKASYSGNCALELVLPYPKAGMEDMEGSFDSIIIPEELHGAHPKRAITLRNRWMIDRSDLLICCVNRSSGGAAATLKYAVRKEIEVINLATL